MSSLGVCHLSSPVFPFILTFFHSSVSNILAGSYDSHVYIFDASQKPIHTISGHAAPVTSVCWIWNQKLIASASQDCTARLTRIPDIVSQEDGESGGIHALASLHLHTAPVSSITANTDGTLLLTTSWDMSIGIWNTTIPDIDQVPDEDVFEDRKKRRKVAGGEGRPVRKVRLPFERVFLWFLLIIFIILQRHPKRS